MLFETIKDYEELVLINDKATGLKAIVCIHDTTLGTALGGCRIFNYKTEEEAIFDVTRLAKGMTYKSAAAGLNWGGGKSIIIGDPSVIKSEYLFRAFGRHIQGLGGRYITAEDVGSNVHDMSHIAKETDYVCGRLGRSGDPSPHTAYGVYVGIKAAVKEQLKVDSLKGLTIAVQGLGNVAYNLCALLHKDGVNLVVTDINKEKCDRVQKEFNAKVVSPEEILSTKCDVLSPNAMGAIINDKTIDALKTTVIAGGANNQLLTLEHADMLKQKGILYTPDYVINAGGLINVTQEFHEMTPEMVKHMIDNIGNTLAKIFALAKEKNISTYKAADSIAEARIASIRDTQKIFVS